MELAEEYQQAVGSVLDLKAALEALPSGARLSNADTDAIYTLAYNMVAQARYESALRYFSLLTLYRPTHKAYLSGLALSYRMLERYDEALNVYAFLATIDPDDAEHSLAIAECLLLRQEFEQAQQLVETVIRYCKEHAASDRARTRAQALHELIVTPRGAASA